MSLLQSLFIAFALSAFLWQTSASTKAAPGSGFQYSRQADIQPAQTSFRYPRRGKRAPNSEQQKHVETPQKYEQDSRMTESVSQDSSSSVTEARHSTSFVAECEMPTAHGDFRMRSYRHESSSQKLEPVVIVSGDVNDAENVIVRVHDQCFTSEVFGSLRCDCREQLQESLKLIREKNGLVIYLLTAYRTMV
jgi:GTP cyclohydrolase II